MVQGLPAPASGKVAPQVAAATAETVAAATPQCRTIDRSDVKTLNKEYALNKG